MPKLEIIRTERKEIRFFLGWNADQSCIYAQDKKGNYRLIPIELPSLDLHDLIGNSVGLSFKNRPFPKSAPIRIEPFRLIPPPCRAARDYDPKTLKHNAREPFEIPEEWAVDYGDYLFPDEEDKTLISNKLKKYQAREKRRYKEASHRNPVRFKTLDLNDKSKWIWDLTLEEAILRNSWGVRDRVLIRSWLSDNGLDLQMLKSRQHDFKASLSQMLIHPFLLEELSASQWKTLHARVKYVVLFEDGKTFYLRGIKRDSSPQLQTDVDSIKILKENEIVTYSFAETCEKLGRGENAIRRYLKRLNIDRNKITDLEIAKMIELRDKISKRPDLAERNRKKS